MNTKDPTDDEIQSLPNSYESTLLEKHGELMDGAALRILLHMKHERTFRRAIAASALPVGVFRLAGRKGWYARTRDVAAWLASVGNAAGTGLAERKPERKPSRSDPAHA